MERRNFFKGLLGLGAIAVLPKVEIKEEPAKPKKYEWKNYYHTIKIKGPPIPKEYLKLINEQQKEMNDMFYSDMFRSDGEISDTFKK